MVKKGSWFSAIKRVFTPHSKEKLSNQEQERKNGKEKKKKGFGKRETNSFLPMFREPSSIEKILGDAERDHNLVFRPPDHSNPPFPLPLPRPASPRATTSPRTEIPRSDSPRPVSPKLSDRSKPPPLRPVSPQVPSQRISTPIVPSPRPNSLRVASPQARKPPSPRADLPKLDLPRPPSPRAEPPRLDLPRSDPPRLDAPRSPSPRSDPSRLDAPRPPSPRSDPLRSTTPKPPSPRTEPPRLDVPRPPSPRSTTPKPPSSRSEPPRLDAPRPPSPRSDPPRSTTPKPPSPRTEPPKLDAPRSTTPKPPSPRAEPPRLDSPIPPSPRADPSRLDAPRPPSPRAVLPVQRREVVYRPEPTLLVQNASATKIQAVFRRHTARKSFRALKGLVRLQGVVRGYSVKRQTINAMKYMQQVVRVQSQIQSRRIKMLERQANLEKDEAKTGNDDWDDSVLTKEERDARTQRKIEAIVKRERSMAYAYSHKVNTTNSSSSSGFPQWWNWKLHHNQQPIRDYRQTPTRPSPSPLSTPKSSRSTLFTPSRPFRTSTSRYSRGRYQDSPLFKDDDSLTSCPPYPSYMAPTVSAKAKVRPNSNPKERVLMSANTTPRRMSYPPMQQQQGLDTFRWNNKGSLLMSRGGSGSGSPGGVVLEKRKTLKSVGNLSIGSTVSMPASVGGSRKPFNRFV